jgi:hypothetical protein
MIKLKRVISYLAVAAATPLCLSAGAVRVDLGTAGSFAVLAGSTITNTGTTNIQGDVGVWPGDATTGLTGVTVSGGTAHAGDSVAMQAQNDLTTAYSFAAGEACGTVLTGQDLGNRTLTAGVYCFDTSAALTGALTLDGQGDPNASFVFQIGSTLTTASSSSVVLTHGATGGGIFWQVGSSATLGTSTSFAGTILALTSISLDTGANLSCGSALARNGAVTLDSNSLSIDPASCGTTAGNSLPEPSTASLVLLMGATAMVWRFGVRPGVKKDYKSL